MILLTATGGKRNDLADCDRWQEKSSQSLRAARAALTACPSLLFRSAGRSLSGTGINKWNGINWHKTIWVKTTIKLDFFFRGQLYNKTTKL